MQNIEAHYAQAPDKPLAHYTSAAGLVGILQSRSIWATNIRFLNDTREFLHATDLAKSYVLAAKSTSARSVSGVLAYTLVDQPERMQGTTWIASFSERGDLLSQWRGYCPHGGYSVIFRPKPIAEVARRHQLAFARCIYERSVQDQMICELVDAAIESFPTLFAASTARQHHRRRSKGNILFCQVVFPEDATTGKSHEGPCICRGARMAPCGRAEASACNSRVPGSRLNCCAASSGETRCRRSD
jgi:hypothetical protein